MISWVAALIASTGRECRWDWKTETVRRADLKQMSWRRMKMKKEEVFTEDLMLIIRMQEMMMYRKIFASN